MYSECPTCIYFLQYWYEFTLYFIYIYYIKYEYILSKNCKIALEIYYDISKFDCHIH